MRKKIDHTCTLVNAFWKARSSCCKITIHVHNISDDKFGSFCTCNVIFKLYWHISLHLKANRTTIYLKNVFDRVNFNKGFSNENSWLNASYRGHCELKTVYSVPVTCDFCSWKMDGLVTLNILYIKSAFETRVHSFLMFFGTTNRVFRWIWAESYVINGNSDTTILRVEENETSGQVNYTIGMGFAIKSTMLGAAVCQT